MSWGRFTASAPVGTSPSRSTVGSPRWGGPSHSGARPGSGRSRPTARSVPVRTPSRSTSCRRRAARSSSTGLASRRRLRNEAAEKLAELRRLGERAQAIERVLAVDHHRAPLEAAVVVVVTEANPVGTASALVLEQLDRRFGVPAHVRRLLHDLASAPVELKRARYLASTLRIRPRHDAPSLVRSRSWLRATRSAQTLRRVLGPEWRRVPADGLDGVAVGVEDFRGVGRRRVLRPWRRRSKRARARGEGRGVEAVDRARVGRAERDGAAPGVVALDQPQRAGLAGHTEIGPAALRPVEGDREPERAQGPFVELLCRAVVARGERHVVDRPRWSY